MSRTIWLLLLLPVPMPGELRGQEGGAAVAARAARSEAAPVIASAAGTSAATSAPATSSAAAIASAAEAEFARPAKTWLDAQLALTRRGFSCGSIDGKNGPQTRAALRAFQANEGLRATGALDEATAGALVLRGPDFLQREVTAEDLARLQPLDPAWLGKSRQSALAHTGILEMFAEESHAHPALVRTLNPDIDWERVGEGEWVTLPDVARESPPPDARAARALVFIAERMLQALDADGRVLAHFPVSIARHVEKRPLGSLKVTVVIRNPDYTFAPENFPESAEARELGQKLILPPGPNNPVGVAWIGLDRPGYGIHGTPEPEKVGRTESHGCFRLANSDARLLLELAWVGMPVEVLE
ncbi:MAG: L,D-transpeptidase [Opitutaceae bacterium]|nr:L,D-transpeptidase [Opitutaceae bacterium]